MGTLVFDIRGCRYSTFRFSCLCDRISNASKNETKNKKSNDFRKLKFLLKKKEFAKSLKN